MAMYFQLLDNSTFLPTGPLVLIKSPPNEGFKISKFRLSKLGRVASGKMTGEILPNGKKRKFEFDYPVISGADRKVMEDFIDTDFAFFLFSYPEDNIQKTAIVYAGAPSAEKFRTDSGWYWKNFKFDLIEQ